jgi:hypothetical protein
VTRPGKLIRARLEISAILLSMHNEEDPEKTLRAAAYAYKAQVDAIYAKGKETLFLFVITISVMSGQLSGRFSDLTHPVKDG